jgi:hypothetical protein
MELWNVHNQILYNQYVSIHVYSEHSSSILKET